MRKFNVEKIKDMVTIEDVIWRLGFETKQIGRMTSILCPFHGDQHFGSAFLRKGSLYCYVCNKVYDIFDIYQRMFDLTFMEAVEHIINDFSLSECSKDMQVMMPFRKNELRLIGLGGNNRDYYPIGFRTCNGRLHGYMLKKEQQEYYVDDKIQGIDEHYVLSKKGSASWQHLNTLYKENLKLFQEILLDKCKESYQIYKEQYLFFRELNEHISCKENETFMWVCLTMMQKISDIQVKVKELL